MEKKKILCIHHIDLDGAGAAAVVGLYHESDEVVYKKHNYGQNIDPKDLMDYDIIYAVDISFKDQPWVYDVPGLVWIDHHISAITDRPDSPIPGIRRDGTAGCELTWEYLFPGVPCPSLIQYLGTYDVWCKTRYPWRDVEYIQMGAKYKYGIEPPKILQIGRAHV